MAEMSHADAPAKAEVEVSSQANKNKDSRPVYEVGYHIVPTVEEEKVGEVVEQIRKALDSAGAEVIKDTFPQKLALAYTIERSVSGKREKYTSAYFGAIKFAAERDAVSSVEEMLRTSKEILRHLLIETTREEQVISRRAVYSSNRLEGETIKKPTSTPEESGEVSEEDLEKSIDALVN